MVAFNPIGCMHVVYFYSNCSIDQQENKETAKRCSSFLFPSRGALLMHVSIQKFPNICSPSHHSISKNEEQDAHTRRRRRRRRRRKKRTVIECYFHMERTAAAAVLLFFMLQ